MAEKFNPVFEINPQEYNKKLAEALKSIKEMEKPEWVDFIKTGSSKERPPQDNDFWYNRAASILRQIYINKVVGVNRLKTKYGSRKRRGSKPEEFRRASGKVIRSILQQSDKAGLTEIAKDIKNVRSKKPGRQLTSKGKELLESIGGENGNK